MKGTIILASIISFFVIITPILLYGWGYSSSNYRMWNNVSICNMDND